MAERINGTIETQVSEGNTLISQYSDVQPVQTVVQDVPQVQTILQNGINVSSQINAPFVEVTSVNGMTGDVITEAEILDFEANKYYRKNTLVNYDGRLYWAKENFTSGSTFDSDDWNIVEAGDIDWSDISNKPTFATVATSGSYNDLSNKPNLATVATSGSYTDLINTPSPYSLPVASNSVLGGIKVGDNLSIDNNGILSATASGQGGKVYYFTDTLNTSVSGSFPSTFRIFKDENYTEEAEFGDINADLDSGVALTVRVEQRYQTGFYLWGTVESGFVSGGQDVFCVKLMGNTMSYPTDFRILNFMDITPTTYYYQGYDITPISSIPTASTSTKGTVRIGNGLNVTSAGLLSTKLQFTDGDTLEDVKIITLNDGGTTAYPVTTKEAVLGLDDNKFDASFLYACIYNSTAFTQEQAEALKDAILADKEILVYEANQTTNKRLYRPHYVSASEDSVMKSINVQLINQAPARVMFSFSSINGADWTLTVRTTNL